MSRDNSDINEELCIFGEFNSLFIPNSDKSIFKIFYI